MQQSAKRAAKRHHLGHPKGRGKRREIQITAAPHPCELSNPRALPQAPELNVRSGNGTCATTLSPEIIPHDWHTFADQQLSMHPAAGYTKARHRPRWLPRATELSCSVLSLLYSSSTGGHGETNPGRGESSPTARSGQGGRHVIT